MDLRQLELEEVSFEEYDRLRENFPWPCQRLGRDFVKGFARIVSPLEFADMQEMLYEFIQCPTARRVSVKLEARGWDRRKRQDMDYLSIRQIINTAERTGNIIYLGFVNGIFDPNINFEIGFGEQDKRVASVCACLPGYLKGIEYQWQAIRRNRNKEYVEIHALAD